MDMGIGKKGLQEAKSKGRSFGCMGGGGGSRVTGGTGSQGSKGLRQVPWKTAGRGEGASGPRTPPRHCI